MTVIDLDNKIIIHYSIDSDRRAKKMILRRKRCDNILFF